MHASSSSMGIASEQLISHPSLPRTGREKDCVKHCKYSVNTDKLNCFEHACLWISFHFVGEFLVKLLPSPWKSIRCGFSCTVSLAIYKKKLAARGGWTKNNWKVEDCMFTECGLQASWRSMSPCMHTGSYVTWTWSCMASNGHMDHPDERASGVYVWAPVPR